MFRSDGVSTLSFSFAMQTPAFGIAGRCGCAAFWFLDP
jgi:hypothetical protein